MEKFTGNKDLDFLILQQISDLDLRRLCRVNRYLNSLCNDENFWMKRIILKIDDTLSYEDIQRLKIYLGINSNKELYNYFDSMNNMQNVPEYCIDNFYRPSSLTLNVKYVIELFKEEESIDGMINLNLLPKNKIPEDHRVELMKKITKDLSHVLHYAEMYGFKVPYAYGLCISKITNLVKKNFYYGDDISCFKFKDYFS